MDIDDGDFGSDDERCDEDGESNCMDLDDFEERDGESGVDGNEDKQVKNDAEDNQRYLGMEDGYEGDEELKDSEEELHEDDLKRLEDIPSKQRRNPHK